MAEAEIYRAIREQREGIERGEVDMLRQLAKDWIPTRQYLLERIDALTAEILDKMEAGEPVGPSYIYALERYQTMLNEAEAAVDQYNKAADGIITGYEADAVDLGIHNAIELVDIAEPTDPMWTRINKRETRVMRGMLSEPSPLSTLLDKSWGEMKTGIEKVFVTGIATGQDAPWFAARMKETVDIAPKRAMTIARTEVNRAYRAANLETMRTSRAVKGYRRICYKPTACFACLMMDGDYYDKMEDFSDHPNGKCAAVPVTRHYDPAGEEDWEKGEAWFMNLPEKDQKRIIGDGRYQLWKEDSIDPKDMVYIKDNKLWGGSPTVRTIQDLKKEL